MSNMGANCAILDDEKRILLVKREDFEVWCLPGGMTDPGESLAQTAIREAKEETGLDVKLEQLVGVYTRVGGYGDLHGALFTSTISGGEIKPQIEEVIDIDWFALDDLPENIFWWHVPQIEDAIQGARGVAGCAILREAEPIQTRQELYAKRDASGMGRTEFYRYYFEKNGKDYQREL